MEVIAKAAVAMTNGKRSEDRGRGRRRSSVSSLSNSLKSSQWTR